MSCDIFSHCQLTQALKFDEEVMFELVVVFKTRVHGDTLASCKLKKVLTHPVNTTHSIDSDILPTPVLAKDRKWPVALERGNPVTQWFPYLPVIALSDVCLLLWFGLFVDFWGTAENQTISNDSHNM